MDVVVRQSSAVIKLLASEDDSLRIGRDALLVLDLLLDTFNVVRAFYLEGNGLSGQCTNEDLHASCYCLKFGFINYKFMSVQIYFKHLWLKIPLLILTDHYSRTLFHLCLMEFLGIFVGNGC